jgi:hypothetical protein
MRQVVDRIYSALADTASISTARAEQDSWKLQTTFQLPSPTFQPHWRNRKSCPSATSAPA